MSFLKNLNKAFSDSMDVDKEDDIVEKIKNMNIKSKVKFTHSIYGMMKRGEYKGREVEVREYYPGKIEVLVDKKSYISIGKKMEKGDKIMGCEVLSEVEKPKNNIYKYSIVCKKNVLFSKGSIKKGGDNATVLKGELKGMTGKIIKDHKAKLLVSLDASGGRVMKFVNVDDIFYMDLVLDTGNYFHIDSIEFSNNAYKIFGKERVSGKGDITRVITLSDIKKYMPGTNFGDKIKSDASVRREIPDDVQYIDETGEKEEVDEDEADEGYEMDEEDEGEIEFVDVGPEMVASYKDIERTEFITQQLTSIQRGYYDMIETILDTSGESIENLNAYDIINDIELVVEKLNIMISDAKINFDITASKIDMKMLIALLVAYEMKRRGLIFENFKIYLTDLFNKNYFYTTLDELMVSFFLRKDNTIFKCDFKNLRELYKKKKYYSIIEELMECFDGILRTILNISVTLNGNEVETVGVLEKVEPIIKERPRKFMTFEDIIENRMPRDAKRVLWNPIYQKVIDDFKNVLTESMKTIEGEAKLEVDKKKVRGMEEKYILYKYVYENLESGPIVLDNLGMKLKDALASVFSDFNEEYNMCTGGEDVDIRRDIKCRDLVIKKYLDKLFEDKKGKLKGVSEEDYLDMKKYYELSRIFSRLVERINEKVRMPKKEETERRLRQFEMEREKLLKRRREVMKSSIDEEELLEGISDITLDSDLIGLTSEDEDSEKKRVRK
jgi:hypothetical protein